MKQADAQIQEMMSNNGNDELVKTTGIIAIGYNDVFPISVFIWESLSYLLVGILIKTFPAVQCINKTNHFGMFEIRM